VKFENHFHVYRKSQLAAALRAGSYPTYAEARANPFTIHLAGTNFKLTFPNGLHETDALRASARVNRLNQKVFQPE
jgi:hypothetical protein